MRKILFMLFIILFSSLTLATSQLPSTANTLLLCHFNSTTTCNAGEVPTKSQGVTYQEGLINNGSFISSQVTSNLTYGWDGGNNILNTSGTIEVWFKSKNNIGIENPMLFSICNGVGSCTEQLFLQIPAGNTLLFRNTKNSNFYDLSYSIGSTILKDVWHHYAITWNSSSANTGRKEIYFDGNLVASVNTFNVTFLHNLTIGSFGNGLWANGTFEEFVIYNESRSSAQIYQDYKITNPIAVSINSPSTNSTIYANDYTNHFSFIVNYTCSDLFSSTLNVTDFLDGTSIYSNNSYQNNSQMTRYMNVSTGYHNFTTYCSDGTYSTYETSFFNLTTNTINLTFRNDVSKSIINNVSFELISPIYSNNYSTTTGNSYLELLSPTTYTIRYFSAGYTSRFYIFLLTNRTINSLSLYLSQNTSSQECTITVVNEANKPVEGAYVKTYKYDLSTNSYLLQEIIATNFEGKVNADLLLNTEYYKFIVEYPLGTISLETTPTYIYSTSLRLQIITTQKAAENYFNLLDVDHYLTFNNGTNNFRFFYSYGGTDMSLACLKIYRIDTTTDTFINSSCTNTASATLLVGVTNSTGSRYRGDAYVTLSGEEYLLRSYFQEFPEASGAGIQGWWFVLIITAAVIPIYMWDKTLGLIAAPLPTLLFSFMGLIDLPTWIAVSMEVVFVIIAYWVSKK